VFTVATAVLVLLQVPPDVADVSDAVVPVQSVSGPDIAAGLALAETTAVTVVDEIV
jgi:hypothetical protein